MMPRFVKYLFISGFILGSLWAKGQEKMCIPDALNNKKIKAVIYLNDGDSIKAKFYYLSPTNNIRTTHIMYKADGKKKYLSRFLIRAYYNTETGIKKYKVYPSPDSVFVKKECRFDMGVFMDLMVAGPYKLLSNKLEPKASIQAYSQTVADDIYYILTPRNKLIKIYITDLKPQISSLFVTYPETRAVIMDPGFNIDALPGLVERVNKSILKNEMAH